MLLEGDCVPGWSCWSEFTCELLLLLSFPRFFGVVFATSSFVLILPTLSDAVDSILLLFQKLFWV